MAMIGQFSFYDPERIGKFKPYKIGAGYFLGDKKFFVLVGPGIRISL
jgi:hypothetical protein